MSQITFSSSGSTIIPHSQQHFSSDKETMKKVRNCFRQLQEKLKNPAAAELAKEIQPLLHEYSPTDFSQSLKLLNATQTVSEKFESLSKSLASGHFLLQSVDELRGVLQAYDHRLFANYFGRKSSKDKASFIHLKYPFISWCLQQAERSFKEKKIDEAQMFWSFCDRLVPMEFHQGLNFYENEDKILRAIGLIREQLNAKKALHEKLLELVQELQSLQKSCELQQKHLLANLQKTIEETLLELEKKYDSVFYEYRFQRLQEFLSKTGELCFIEQKLNRCISDLKALHCKSLEYEILTLQDKIQVIERVLSKIPYDLEKGVPVEGLLKDLSWDQVRGFTGNKQLVVKFLDLCSWMVENEDRLAKDTVLLFQYKFDDITALLGEVFSQDNLKKVSSPSQHLPIADPEFEAKLLETMKTFSEFMQADNIEAAAKQAQELIQSLKKFQPIDEEHEKKVRERCDLFFNAHKHYQKIAEKFPKNRGWQIIKNALKSIGDGKLIKKKSGLASSSIEPQLQELTERIRRFKEALENYRLPQAFAICEEFRNSVRKLGAEAFPMGKALLEWVQQEGPRLLNNSQESLSKYLTGVRTTLYQTALQLAEMEPQGSDGISLQCAELIGEAYLQIHERAKHQSLRKKDGAEHAIFWFEMVLGKNPNHASLLFKLGPLYQYLGQEEEMWRVYQEACRIQPDYFEAVNRTGCEYFKLGRRDEMLELYLESVKYPFLSDHFSISSSSQIHLHRNLLQELMRREDYERAFPLLVKLKDYLLKTNTYLYRRELDEVAYWLTLVPKEISHFTAQDFQALIRCCDQIETQNACEFKIYQHCVEEEDYIRAAEYKWKILAGRAVTSERYQTMYEAQVYCQFSRSETNTKAIQMYKSIIAKWPSYFPAYYRLYHFYLNTKDDELAEEMYQKMVALSLPSFRLTDSFGRIWKALEEQGIDPDFYCGVADHFREQHKYELAEKLYKKALEIDPYHINAHYGIGCLFQTIGRVQEACEQFQMIVDTYETISENSAYIAQRYFNFLIQFGNEPMRTRDREWAKTHFDEACEEIKADLKRQKPELLSRVHVQLADLLESKEAVNHLDAAIALRPKDYKAYASKAQKAWHENPTEAVRCLQQAILCYPMFYQEWYQRLQLILPSYTSSAAALVYQTIGKGFLDQQRVEEALYNFEIARELNPSCEAISELLGECYLKQKRYQAAHASFVRAGKVEKAEQALNRWNRLCRFPKYGDFFKESLERIRSQLHDLKIMEMSGIASFFVSKSTEPSPSAKNKRQSILMQSQNLLNQCMQLFSTCFQQAYPEKGDMSDEFPVRRMVARQQPFESSVAKALLIDFKEKVPELYSFLREYYEKEHEQIESFIQQANHEKHAQHGEQFLGSQTTITIDHRSNTQTTTIRPMYFDRATGKNPAEDCSQIIDLVEHLVDTIFTHLDGRLSNACLQSMIKNKSVASQVWSHLVSIGWINNEGKILINTQEPLELKRFKQYEDLIIDYIRKIAGYPRIALTFETHFDLERDLFLGDTDSQPLSELSSLSQNLTLEDLVKNYVVKAQQLAKEGNSYQAIMILRQWSKWHQNPIEAFGLLGDLLWDRKHYYEALQAYRLAKTSQPEKEKLWETRESSWGDVAFQIEEVKNLLIRLSFVSKTNSQEVLNLHAEIVAKLTHSLDHAIHSYSKTRFALSQDIDLLVLKELFFPIAGEEQKPEERVEQVFEFLSRFGKRISDDEPEFFKYLCQIQPCIDPDYKCLGILHDAVNVEKHRRFLLCKSEDKKTVYPNLCQRQDLKFYYDAIEKIEEIHEQIAYYKNLDRTT